MSMYLRTGLAACTELIVLFLLGGLIQPAEGEGETSVCETMLFGSVLLMAALELTALPMTIAKAKLTTFFCVWAVVLGLMLAISCVLRFRGFFKALAYHARNFRLSWAFLLMVILTAVLGVISVLTIQGLDSGRTISQAATDLYTNTIGLTDGSTGERLTSFSMQNLLNRYHLADEFYAMLFQIPILVQMKLIHHLTTVLLATMAGYRIFLRLLDRKKPTAALATTLFMLVMLTSRTAFSEAELILGQSWTGNAILTGILIPTFLILILILYEDVDSAGGRAAGMLIGTAAISLTKTAMFLMPCVMLFTSVPLLIVKKKGSLLPHVLLWLVIPVIAIVLALYQPALNI